MPDTDFTPALNNDLAERMRVAGLRKENERAWAEVGRLQAAKTAALKVADERSKENVALRHILKGIAEFCSGDNRTLGAIERLAHIQNTVHQALRHHEQTLREDGK